MSYFNEAVEQDTRGNYIRASELYERAIEEDEGPDAFINLAVLYFQFTDVGINAHLQLPLGFVHRAMSRFDEVVNRGIAKFPDNAELRFWKKYFRFSSLGDELEEGEVLSILEGDESSLIPYFFLYLLNPEKYKNQRVEIVADCGKLLTAKNKWILSLIS